MTAEQFTLLIHPTLVVISVFPLIGIVCYFAWETRQRRLQIKAGEKSKIPPLVGKNHVEIGKWLSTAVVTVSLIGLARPIIAKNIVKNTLWATNTFQFIFLILIFLFTIITFILLFRARNKLWRGIFATLSGMGVVILGCQDGIFRRTNEWYWSHYYYGVIVTLLMIFSVAIIDDIYRDKSLKWRNIHIILNCLALLLFIGQGYTGARDLFEIGLWSPPPS
ncbi:DUF4079 domain-containing protein [Cyanobacterium aponinum UTEX 3222]|uniref:DUF4079 domain-containing protein n=1 Tax=Cyanobacterium aponinum (strain PCC 10605) TaxID=755178 RepID=K9Z7F1_CYAAP|nr:DUF4079 domain-containing protein [Cyanobacterium aponinum]WRL42894.1 DUF4079 domain-containing protein [Cyanobacterium aponinum UTEX 3222]AFZ55121.1 hypothetical protein Cyan10605_3064 [Cyanobacterium aponinum PCC 10605]MBD2394919.1 DUF4079 domain-containing protein [Cyanobacterium aponinum FACHB-4101]PHV63628.1 DUF4079 domain-containing protein [Cyanobacterium aponinum IPPAS B-1201]WRL40004.1 DUF4079 domain-containing protein [Cyanobacterium aponinum UTEX 3221]